MHTSRVKGTAMAQDVTSLGICVGCRVCWREGADTATHQGRVSGVVDLTTVYVRPTGPSELLFGEVPLLRSTECIVEVPLRKLPAKT